MDEGAVATFQVPENITNIITRVTGDNITAIYGELRSEIPGANLYFINPNGIFFHNTDWLRPIDPSPPPLLKSLHLGTADYLEFEDGGRFDVAHACVSLGQFRAFGSHL